MIEAIKFEGLQHVICQCDKCKTEKQEQDGTLIDEGTKIKQEPVDWYSIEGETRHFGVGMVECAFAVGKDEVVYVITHESVKDIVLQYLPKREWVELTDQELVALRERVQEYTPIDSVKYGEAIQRAMAEALKEKNA